MSQLNDGRVVMATSRNLCFDQIKGVLILLVILGHVVLGSLEQSWLRSLIYFFHMPLFLAVTGYFIKTSLLDLPIKDIIKKYQARLIVPFLLAAAVYYALMSYQQSLLTTLKTLIPFYPYYHLWYVPAVLLFVGYLKCFYVLYQKNHHLVLYGLCVFCLLSTIYFESYAQWHLSNHWLYQALGDKRFYYFFSYFAFGFLWSHHKHLLPRYAKVAPMIFFGALMMYHFSNVAYVMGFAKVMANLALIVWVLYLCQYQKLLVSRVLAKIGAVSLPIYLWHVLPLLLLQTLPLSVNRYYTLSLLVFTLLIALAIYFEDKNAIINRLFYGKVGIHHAT